MMNRLLLLILLTCSVIAVAVPATSQIRYAGIWQGTCTATTTAACTFTNSSAVGFKTYISSLQCGRTDTGTTPITVTLNDNSASVYVLPNSGGGVLVSVKFDPALVMANLATAATFTASSSISSVICNAQGYFAP